MAILSKGCKPDNFESSELSKNQFYKYLWTSLKFCWMWIFPWIKFSWHSGSIRDKLGWLNWSDNCSVRSYLPLIWKNSITHMHGLAVYVKEERRFAQDLSLENSVDSCLRLALLHSVSYFFFLYQSPFSSLCTVFDSTSSNIHEVLFFISNDLTQIVNFPTQILDFDSHRPALLDLFLSSDASICSTISFLPLGNSDHVIFSVSIDFP